MRFGELRISNFRGISSFEVGDLATMVVIAGPNGCGKSSIFDAVRLLKSAYGGYQLNEWQSWFGEFQINLAHRDELARLFRDLTKPVEIAAALTLSEAEVSYLHENAEAVLEPLAWKEVMGREYDRSPGAPALATELRVHGPRVQGLIETGAAGLRESLHAQPFRAKLTISPALNLEVETNQVLEVVFQTFDPESVGIIDYHGPMRIYPREQLGGLSLNIEDSEQRRKQHSLYNWQNKYQNVKSELAATYVRELIAKDANVAELSDAANLNQALIELFQTFFPDKTYSGPRPTPRGVPEFPVVLATGEEHDIDDLSSGEKEVLYGYLRLRASAPRNSVILLDEPELHLNPALLQGLPDFYHRHLGRALGNQLWLLTHSDALLRQSVGNQNFSVFHMRGGAATPSGENQALAVEADDELDRAIIDLVGDLATYKPHAKVVILEGSDGEFDRLMVSRLFPLFASRVNLVSGGSKRRVDDLYEILATAGAAAGLADRFFAVVDRDSGRTAPPEEARTLTWDRYHIENYLLEPLYISAAVNAVSTDPPLKTEAEINAALVACAQEIVQRLVLEELQADVNHALISSINIGANRDSTDPASDLQPSIKGSASRLNETIAELLGEGYLADRARTYQKEFDEALVSGAWTSRFPGRLVLGRFTSRHVDGVSYEQFRNLIIDQMLDDAFEPPGMKAIVDSIDET